MQFCKTLLFHERASWIKKTGNKNFDVSVGCFDRAEVCELVGSNILSKLKVMIKKEDGGPYRNDGLGAFREFRRRFL